MNRSKINIGTYYLAPYAYSEEHVKELAECGIDMVVNMRHVPEVLDWFYKYGEVQSLPEYFRDGLVETGQMQVQCLQQTQ